MTKRFRVTENHYGTYPKKPGGSEPSWETWNKFYESEHLSPDEALREVHARIGEHVAHTRAAGGKDCGRSWMSNAKRQLEEADEAATIWRAPRGEEGKGYNCYEVAAVEEKTGSLESKTEEKRGFWSYLLWGE
jgi:hypothetical protein